MLFEDIWMYIRFLVVFSIWFFDHVTSFFSESLKSADLVVKLVDTPIYS
jgi:hypothetical protein